MSAAKRTEEARRTPTPARRALDEVVARVREDAARDPRRYLESAEVPEGGE